MKLAAIKRNFEQGLQHYEAKEYKTAIKYFSRIVEYDTRLGNNPFKNFLKIQNPHPYQSQTRQYRALCYLLLHEFNKAVEDVQYIHTGDAALATADYIFGMRSYTSGNYDMALDYFKSAIHKVPTNPIYYAWRAKAYFAKNNFANTIENYTHAIEHELPFFDEKLRRIKIAGNKQRLITYYEKRTHAYFLNGQLDEAMSDAKILIKFIPEEVDYLWYGKLCYSLGKLLEADIAFGKAIKTSEDKHRLSELMSLRARVAFDLQSIDFALTNATDCIELNLTLSRVVKSKTDHLRVTELNSQLSQAFYIAGRCYLLNAEDNDNLNFQFNLAVKQLKQAVYLNPNDHVYHFYLAKSYAGVGKVKQAIISCSEAIKLMPTSDAYYALRGHCYYQQKDYEKALADFDKAIELNPKDASHYQNRAEVNKKLGSFGFAEADESNSYNHRKFSFFASKDPESKRVLLRLDRSEPHLELLLKSSDQSRARQQAVKKHLT